MVTCSQKLERLCKLIMPLAQKYQSNTITIIKQITINRCGNTVVFFCYLDMCHESTMFSGLFGMYYDSTMFLLWYFMICAMVIPWYSFKNLGE